MNYNFEYQKYVTYVKLCEWGEEIGGMKLWKRGNTENTPLEKKTWTLSIKEFCEL